MKIQAYIYHKRAEEYSDCQDYFWIDPKNNRIAVSDGMSQSIYPQWWAQILVNAYIDKGKIPNESELQKYQDVWQDRVQDEISIREKNGKNPWRLKNSFAEKSGAGATLCGFSWNENEWTCECIGDSSLIIVKADFSIEIKSSQDGDYGNHPDYLDSFQEGRGTIKYFQGSFDNVYAVLLVTDPFSELFYLNQHNCAFIEERIREIQSLSNHVSYTALVERWRDEFGMHNDDSTLIFLTDFSTADLQTNNVDILEDLCSNGKGSVVREINKENLNTLDTSNSENRLHNSTIVSKEEILLSDSLCKPNITKEVELREKNTIKLRTVTEDILRSSYNGKRKTGHVLKFLKDLLWPVIKKYCSKK